jgi:hypothetical protein
VSCPTTTTTATATTTTNHHRVLLSVVLLSRPVAMQLPAFVTAILACIRSVLEQVTARVHPEDPLDTSARMARISSHAVLFNPLGLPTPSNRKTLVLDLDETLVHSSEEWVRRERAGMRMGREWGRVELLQLLLAAVGAVRRVFRSIGLGAVAVSCDLRPSRLRCLRRLVRTQGVLLTHDTMPCLRAPAAGERFFLGAA